MNLSVTVGIPTYNEQNNIGSLISSIVKQRTKSYTLEKIIIIDDASSDDTKNIVHALAKKYPFIHFISDNVRRGKCFRLNQLYKINTSDILITFDGDIALSSEDVIENITRCFHDKKVQLVGVNDMPAETSNIEQRIVNTWFELWRRIRTGYRDGRNIYNIHGNGMALHKDLASKIQYPIDITADQEFLYLSMIKNGGEFAFAKDATILFHTADSIKEFAKQTSRFLNERDVLYPLFGEWIKKEHYIPLKYKVKKLTEMLVESPFYMTLACLVYGILPYLGHSDPLIKKGMWEQAKSTKKTIKVTTG